MHLFCITLFYFLVVFLSSPPLSHSYVGNHHHHIMLLERGELDGNMNKSFGSGSLKALGSPLRRLTIAKKALATSCSVVCGDVNVTKLENIVVFKQFPESQFIYKTIDVDTSSHDGDVSDASLLQGVANVVINFVHDDLTAMWTPGYVSPERAEAEAVQKNGGYVAAAAADSRQDVCVIRLVIYQLFAKHSYFGPEMIKEDCYLGVLVAASFVADLSEISHSGAKKVLCQMFQKDPAQRISLKDILEHKVSHSLSSSSSRLQLATQSHMDEIKNSQDHMENNQLPLRVGRRQQAQALDSVGRKVNESLELSVSVHKRISQVQKVVDSSERNLDDPKKFLKKLKEPLIRYADTLIKLIKTTDLTIIFVKQLSAAIIQEEIKPGESVESSFSVLKDCVASSTPGKYDWEIQLMKDEDEDEDDSDGQGDVEPLDTSTMKTFTMEL